MARDLIAPYTLWRLALLTPDHVLAASRLEERYHLQFWDALIISVAQRLNAGTILREDFPHGLEIEGISIRSGTKDGVDVPAVYASELRWL